MTYNRTSNHAFNDSSIILYVTITQRSAGVVAGPMATDAHSALCFVLSSYNQSYSGKMFSLNVWLKENRVYQYLGLSCMRHIDVEVNKQS